MQEKQSQPQFPQPPGTNSPSIVSTSPTDGNSQSRLTADVGLGNGRAEGRLSDVELEFHIAHATHLMELAYERYERSGCFSDRGEADAWRIARDDAVRARSVAQVARMEAARGLAA